MSEGNIREDMFHDLGMKNKLSAITSVGLS